MKSIPNQAKIWISIKKQFKTWLDWWLWWAFKINNYRKGTKGTDQCRFMVPIWKDACDFIAFNLAHRNWQWQTLSEGKKNSNRNRQKWHWRKNLKYHSLYLQYIWFEFVNFSIYNVSLINLKVRKIWFVSRECLRVFFFFFGHGIWQLYYCYYVFVLLYLCHTVLLLFFAVHGMIMLSFCVIHIKISKTNLYLMLQF